MDRERVAAPALDHDRAPEERADGRGEDVESAPEQGQSGELALELAARWSSSARRLTRKPMTLRSSWTGSARAIRKATRPARPAAASSASNAASSGSPSTNSRAGTWARANASIRPAAPSAPGATTASDEVGMIARSPGSRPSKAGTRAFITRTQEISRDASSGPTGLIGRAVGKIASRTSRRLAIRLLGCRAATRSSRRRPNSRSKSTYRSERPTIASLPSGRGRAQIRRRGR